MFFIALLKQIGMLNVYVQWNGDDIAMAPFLTALSMAVFAIYAMFDYW